MTRSIAGESARPILNPSVSLVLSPVRCLLVLLSSYEIADDAPLEHLQEGIATNLDLLQHSIHRSVGCHRLVGRPCRRRVQVLHRRARPTGEQAPPAAEIHPQSGEDREPEPAGAAGQAREGSWPEDDRPGCRAAAQGDVGEAGRTVQPDGLVTRMMSEAAPSPTECSRTSIRGSFQRAASRGFSSRSTLEVLLSSSL